MQDLKSALQELASELEEADVLAVFKNLDPDDEGFIHRGMWVEAVTAANPDDELKSRQLVEKIDDKHVFQLLNPKPHTLNSKR